jgi:hypothetical protein
VKANDPVTYPDYRYIADVYNGAELVARLKAYPQPDSKIGVFEIGTILRNYITPVLDPTANQFHAQTLGSGEWNVSGTVIFGEEYGFTQFLNVSGTTGSLFFGHYNGRLLGIGTNLTAVAEFKSERPRITNIYRTTQNCFIPYLNQSISNTVPVTVTLYDSGGGVIATESHTETIPAVASLGILNIGIAGINEFMSPDSVTDQVAYYIVTLTSVLQPAVSIRVNVLCEPKHTVYNLHFLNRWGGWETQSFSKLSRKTIDIEKSEFGKLPYTLSAAGVPEYYNSNNVYNETRSVFASQYKEKMALNTDFLTNSEYEWLADLVLSPMVFIEMEDDSSSVFHVPLIITETNYEFKKSVNTKPNQLTINIEFGDQFAAQYR